ncbi:MAG TPA: ATP-dependent Clp protease proteolytic subunit [Candidatus Scybalocola faecigallinarum]|uniref:ATP-dependent Clp protease proteolytic subunit n=1 Tax=Candidatus Scybalocola faecigallinarum TaxID=2840941 RepID=A0A9D1JRG0_9FIRM|nr:ATP-dependent Clp protease proteolytic subunit [Candidatus Scybalocola faecigallinarum]
MEKRNSKNHMDNNEDSQDRESRLNAQEMEDERIEKQGQVLLNKNKEKHRIHLLSIIGEIEGHEAASPQTKTTKYEHVLPQLASIEDSDEIDGILVLLNTVGGDVEAGLAIGEMIASLTKPTVSLVLGGSHSIGVPLAVSTDYSFIVKTGTMLIHPVRMNGMIIGVPQTYDYFKKIQDRIVGFIADHSRITPERIESLMMETGMLTKDVGSILVGQRAVEEGLIDEIGGISQALKKLHDLIDEQSALTIKNNY